MAFHSRKVEQIKAYKQAVSMLQCGCSVGIHMLLWSERLHAIYSSSCQCMLDYVNESTGACKSWLSTCCCDPQGTKAQSCRMLQVDVVFTHVEHAAARHVVVCKHWGLCLIEGCLTDCLSVRPSVCLFVHSSVCLLTKVRKGVDACHRC